MFDKRTSFLDRHTQPSPEHNLRSKRMGLLDEGKKYPATGSSRSGQPNKLARARLARNYSADAISLAEQCSCRKSLRNIKWTWIPS
jgi:hypothetical protein